MKKIEIVNGYKKYIKGKNEIEILKNINVEFETGKIYIIMGESGAGKTTLLNIIGTLDSLTSGKLFIDGQDVTKLNDNEKAKMRMEKIGFVFQEFYLNQYMTVEENILQPLYINKKYDKITRNGRVESLIQMVNLEDRKKHYPKELSGGEEQRVAIARALANNPDIILADEPTGNLDKDNEIKIFEIFKRLRDEKKCIIVVTHSDRVKKYADVIFKLKEGNIEVDEN